MGVEPTRRAAKDRIAGFEGPEIHRAPFASIASIRDYRRGGPITAACARLSAATRSYSAGVLHTS